jgi:hypothetical protein
MRSLILTACILSLGACGKSDAGTDGGTDTTSGTGSTTSVTTTGSTTGATVTAADTSAEGSGTDTTTSEPVTTSNVTTEPGTTTTEPGTSTTDPGTSTTEPGTSTTDPGSTGTTGAPVDCAMLGPMQCAAEASCRAIIGGKINVAKMCFGKPMFIECVESGACGDALTVACDPAVVPPEPYQFPDTCIPTDWMQCDAPMVMGPCK